MVLVAERMISSDSHVFEPHDLWRNALGSKFGDAAPLYEERKVGGAFQTHDGGYDPAARPKEMAADGVTGEILYPSLALDQFGLTDVALQEACFRIYNDWLIDYCSKAKASLFGVAAISVFNPDNAIKEMARCRDAGMRGMMIWQVPQPELPFTSPHYDKIWAAAQEMNLPVSLHILTGAAYAPGSMTGGPQGRQLAGVFDFAVTQKLNHSAKALVDIIASGALERFPGLKFAMIESEISWIPFVLGSMDKYAERKTFISDLKLLPSEYFRRQMFSSFFNDPPSRYVLGEWGTYNCMWSNDFPHPNSTWPNSRDVIKRDLSHLPEDARRRLLYENVAELYGIR